MRMPRRIPQALKTSPRRRIRGDDTSSTRVPGSTPSQIWQDERLCSVFQCSASNIMLGLGFALVRHHPAHHNNHQQKLPPGACVSTLRLSWFGNPLIVMHKSEKEAAATGIPCQSKKDQTEGSDNSQASVGFEWSKTQPTTIIGVHFLLIIVRRYREAWPLQKWQKTSFYSNAKAIMKKVVPRCFQIISSPFWRFLIYFVLLTLNAGVVVCQDRAFVPATAAPKV